MDWRILLGIRVAIAALVLVGSYFLFSYVRQIFISEPHPTGSLTFSVARFPIDTSVPAGILTLTADLDKNTYSVPNPDPAGTLEYEYRMVATSSRPWIVFVRATNQTGIVSDITKVPFEVYRANLHDVPWNQLNAKINDAQKVTNDPTTSKSFPEISSNGDVVYMARSIFAGKATAVEDWSLHLVPNNGKDTVISSGMYPKWVDADQFVFLKNDGLYLYTMSTKKINRVLGSDQKITSGDTIYVSDDGEYVTWSIPEKRTLLVIEARDWEKGQFTLKGSVPIIGWYPVISPDDNFVALLTEVKLSQGNWFPIISFVDLNTLKLLKSSTFSLNNVYKDTRPVVNLGEVVPPGVNFNYITLNSWLQPVPHTQ